MLVARYSLGRPFNGPNSTATGVSQWLDTMLQDFPFPTLPTSSCACSPALNVWETEAAFHVEAEVPGISMEQLDVSVLEDELTIKGARTFTQPEQATFVRRERPTREFARTITLPAPIDAEKVEAKLVNGVLSVTLPKVAAAQPRKIAVNAANAA